MPWTGGKLWNSRSASAVNVWSIKRIPWRNKIWRKIENELPINLFLENLRKWSSSTAMERLCDKPYRIHVINSNKKPVHLKKGDTFWISDITIHIHVDFIHILKNSTQNVSATKTINIKAYYSFNVHMHRQNPFRNENHFRAFIKQFRIKSVESRYRLYKVHETIYFNSRWM